MIGSEADNTNTAVHSRTERNAGKAEVPVTGEDTISRWVKIISRYPDASFFFIARNYLGQISTPFHKPQIVEKLTRFFLTPLVRERILSLIDDKDCMLISAVMLMDAPSKKSLQGFFSERLSYVELHKRLVNLEERLIIVPHPDTTDERMTINPLFHDDLYRRIVSFYPLLGDKPPDEHTSTVSGCQLMDGEFIKAVLNLLASNRLSPGEPVHRTDSRNAVSVFPAWPTERLGQALELLLAAIENSQLFTLQDGRLAVPDRTRIREVLSLPPHHFFSLVLAWLLVSRLSLQPHTLEAVQQSLSEFLSTMLRLSPMYVEGIPRLISICFHANGLDSCRVHAGTVQDILELCGALQRDQNRVYLSDSLRPLLEPHGTPAPDLPLIIDSDGILSYKHLTGVPVHNLISLAADIKSVDTYVHYEITRSSFRRARDMGISLEDILQEIENAAGGKLPSFLRERLTVWEELYGEARIFDGITLACSQRLSRIIEHLPALRPHVQANIAEGIYLMNRATEAHWRKILEDAGADMMPATIGMTSPQKKSMVSHLSGEKLQAWRSIPLLKSSAFAHGIPLQRSSVVRNTSFLEHMDMKIREMGLRGDTLQEMESRIANKLVLVDSQLVKDRLYSGILSASGFDYQGKLNLCKSAVGDPSIVLELHLGGDTEDVLVVQAVEIIDATKKNAMLKVRIMPEGQERIIPISSIFHVKRERFSLF